MSTLHSDIYFGNQMTELGRFIQKGSYGDIFILVDQNTKKYCLPIFKNITYKIIEINAGEKYKNIETCQKVWEQLFQYKADRHSLLVNLGGGVIGDLGGFVASTYKRGIDFVQIPTTLLAMADASIGGKLGVDYNELKNVIGLFNQPKKIFIHPDFLKTLSKDQILSGFAEIIKCGLIADSNLFGKIEQVKSIKEIIKKEKIIAQAIKIKQTIVKQDPLEVGIRKSLNFGHTIGHAIESHFLKQKKELLHGYAVAVGMVCEAYLSHAKIGLKQKELDIIVAMIFKLYPKTVFLKNEYSGLISLMYQDKKNAHGKISFSLVPKIGKCKTDVYCTEAEIKAALNFYSML